MVIALCGETGAGKSSLINALLGDNLVRTSGMSAVVTEVRYSTDNQIKADIEYLTKTEWYNEVEHLLQDVKDNPDGRVKHRWDLVEEAAVAWDKMSAVYPSVNEDILSDITVEQLSQQNIFVPLFLGKTVHIVTESSATEMFTSEVSQYIDPSNGLKTASYWPLVRKITIHCPAPVLSTGAVLVDLPGVADSNAARCKVARDYLKRADRVFVVSPITRAVSSKVARDLYGVAFRTQLTLGIYSPEVITFIATKCDDVSPQEILREPALKRKLADCDELKKIDNDIAKHRKNLQSWAQAAKSMTCASVLEQPQRGPNVLTRSRSTTAESASIGMKRPTDNYGKDSLGKRQKISAPLGVSPASGQHTIIESDFNELESLYDKAQFMVGHVQKALSRSMMEKDRLHRSDWSKVTLQEDFRTGLPQFEDLDMKLPVFTCASRDFMRIINKAEDDRGPSCFVEEEDTEIPALSRWILQLTVPAREKAADELFEGLERLITSALAFIEGIPGVTAEDRNALRNRWKSKETHPRWPHVLKPTSRELRLGRYASRQTGVIYRLIKSFETVSDGVVEGLNKSLVSTLKQKCDDSAKLAANAVVKVSDDFASSTYWSTYRATLRRKGHFRRDLNVELTTAFTLQLASSWTRTFSSQHMEKLRATALSDAHRNMRKVTDTVKQTLEGRQKRISRLLAPFIQGHLSDGYEQAARITGAGSVARQVRATSTSFLCDALIGICPIVPPLTPLKQVFHDFLKRKRHTMFQDAAVALQNHLKGAVEAVGERLDEALEGVARKVRRFRCHQLFERRKTV
ncbi:hypothetical protein BD310DRAFT_948455 [Dichomitus squalens]|uniref:Dynamin N-terminal domain-containing protein n=1 Tax=Dichomitus squalens TaxID=114155 RepID=A0A4Q9PW52_9APHY|nr:hypothetical protein BD310DRAFT_948455 [Dichomitus squalens]